MTDIQFVFIQSKVNGAPYEGDKLPTNGFPLPRDSWFSRRLELVRKQQQIEEPDCVEPSDEV